MKLEKTRAKYLPGSASSCARTPPGAAIIDMSGRGIFVEQRAHTPFLTNSFVQGVAEVSIVLSGKGIVRRHARGSICESTVTSGALWFCPEGQAVESLWLREGRLSVLHLYLDLADLLGGLLPSGRGAAGIEVLQGADAVRDVRIEQICHGIVAEVHSNMANGPLLIESLATHLSVLLVRAYARRGEKIDPPCADTGALDRRRLHRVVEFIDAHLCTELSLAKLADVAHLSKFHFSRAFKQATGLTPYAFVTSHRLHRARALLERSDRPLAEIADALGYSSQANFTRAFRRQFGATPGQCRQTLPPAESARQG